MKKQFKNWLARLLRGAAFKLDRVRYSVHMPIVHAPVNEIILDRSNMERFKIQVELTLEDFQNRPLEYRGMTAERAILRKVSAELTKQLREGAALHNRVYILEAMPRNEMPSLVGTFNCWVEVEPLVFTAAEAKSDWIDGADFHEQKRAEMVRTLQDQYGRGNRFKD